MPKSYKEERGPREVVYIVCPLCGRNRVLEATSEEAKAKGKGRLRWDFFDPETSPLVHIREAGGKVLPEGKTLPRKPGQAPAIGFPLKDILTWNDTIKDERFTDQVNAILNQLSRISKLSSKKP